ncbi:unnamed protein product [Urochloa humidicola]
MMATRGSSEVEAGCQAGTSGRTSEEPVKEVADRAVADMALGKTPTLVDAAKPVEVLPLHAKDFYPKVAIFAQVLGAKAVEADRALAARDTELAKLKSEMDTLQEENTQYKVATSGFEKALDKAEQELEKEKAQRSDNVSHRESAKYGGGGDPHAI